VLNFADYFANKQAITVESKFFDIDPFYYCLIDAEKLLKMKGVIELSAASKTFETKKEQAEHELSVGSSYLHN